MSEHPKRYVGGCLCGAVRYVAEGEPRASGHCYCADCRKASGSGFIPFMAFPATAVRFSGVRTERSRPLVVALETWLREQRGRVSKNSDTGKAIDYSLKRWAALTRFLDDGRLCMTNNAAERELRAIAIGRRNWTFAAGPTKAAGEPPPSTHS